MNQFGVPCSILWEYCSDCRRGESKQQLCLQMFFVLGHVSLLVPWPQHVRTLCRDSLQFTPCWFTKATRKLQIPSGNLTQLLKIPHLQLIYLFKMVIFYSYVSLPEGISSISPVPGVPGIPGSQLSESPPISGSPGWIAACGMRAAPLAKFIGKSTISKCHVFINRRRGSRVIRMTRNHHIITI